MRKTSQAKNSTTWGDQGDQTIFRFSVSPFSPQMASGDAVTYRQTNWSVELRLRPFQWWLKVNYGAKKYQACATELSTEQSSEVLLTITRECLGLLSGGLHLVG